MKLTKNNNTLFFIFLILIIPTIVVYYEHALIEIQAHNEAISETKKTKTLAEGVFFMIIGLGYTLVTCLIFAMPANRVPYIIMIVGTIAIVIFYYISRVYAIPIPGTDIMIVDRTSDWRDVVTKICQQILVIPISIKLGMIIYENRLIKVTRRGNREGCESESSVD